MRTLRGYLVHTQRDGCGVSIWEWRCSILHGRDDVCEGSDLWYFHQDHRPSGAHKMFCPKNAQGVWLGLPTSHGVFLLPKANATTFLGCQGPLTCQKRT